MEAARQIEKGDLSLRARVLTQDEIGQLATTFNTMVSRIDERTTERARTELALKQSEQRFRALMEQAADGMFMVRTEGSLSGVNEEACQSLYYTKQELMALSVFDVDMRVSREKFVELRQSLAQGRSMTVDGLHRRKDGSTFPVEVRVGLIESAGREYILALVRDISARVDAEEAQARAEAELEKQRTQNMRSDRLRSLGEMAAGIAHELNQPLVGVRGLAEHIMIGMDKGLDVSQEQIQDRVSSIVDQADRMSHIIEHVRMFAREAGSAKL